jgi:hypothetical protein
MCGRNGAKESAKRHKGGEENERKYKKAAASQNNFY